MPSLNDPANETTPLLPQQQVSPRSVEDVDFDFPPEGYIFTEVLQSPFDWMSDKDVFIVRTVLATLMTIMLGFYFTLEYRAGNGKIFSFRLMNLVWISQCFYMWLVSIWAYIYISTEPTLPYTRRVQSSRHDVLLSIFARSHFFSFIFHCLYTTITTIPFPNTLFYLLILLPNKNTPSCPQIVPEFTINIVSSIIAFAEIFLISSVAPIPGRRCTHHIEQGVFLMALTFTYCTLWVWLGNMAIGQPPDAELDWRLLGGFGKERQVVVTEVMVTVVIYFYGIVEFLHCWTEGSYCLVPQLVASGV